MSNGTWGLSKRAHGGTLTRFINPPKHEPTPRSDAALAVDHAALTEARTVYPSRVFAPSERERVLISGHSNAKIGTAVTKGPWKGFRIYTLSLEERATCPSSCANWDTCYGNAMGMAVRFKHGPDLIRALDRDLAALRWRRAILRCGSDAPGIPARFAVHVASSAHIRRSRSSVQIRGSTTPLASSNARLTLNGRQCSKMTQLPYRGCSRSWVA